MTNERCPKCGSIGWDWANIGFNGAKQCTDCGNVYMTEGTKEMKKFKVIASYVTFCELEVEAENENEAWKLAHDADGGDFEPMKGWQDELSDWNINDVLEIKE